MKMRIGKRRWFRFTVALSGAAFVGGGAGIAAETNEENFSVCGSYIGAGYLIDQKNRAATDASRSRFDAAANIDVNWRLSEKVGGIVQFELGVGNSSVGYNGPVNPGDIHAVLTPSSEIPLSFRLGSFDIPYGAERFHATGHADATNNSFHFNSLMGSALGTRPVSWGGTVGLLAEYTAGPFTIRGAITNGTSGDANNADGNAMYVGELGWLGLEDRLHLSGGYLHSDDRDPRGTTGLNADLRGWVSDARLDWNENTHLAGSYGRLQWGDDVGATRDDIDFWMAEAAWGLGDWQIAGRYSGWEPDDDNGNGTGMSSVLPNPGLAVSSGGVAVNVDQPVHRLQIGGRWRFAPNTYLKAEWFRDSYERTGGYDAEGTMVSVNGAFR